MGAFNLMALSSLLLLFVVSQSVTAVELDFEDDVDDTRMIDDYYLNALYGDDARAGCKDALPGKMTSNSNCKKLKQTCTKLKSKCSKTLKTALGTSSNANKCNTALGSAKNKKVNEYCKITCNKCANGKWSDWGSYGSCSVSCGTGTKTKTRTCTNPEPFGGGSSCSGSSSSSTSCNDGECPINGNWAAWGDWTPCSATCGADGTRSKNRTCTDPAPQHGGDECNSTLSGDLETESCNTDVICPVDGGWGSWGSWGTCSLTCGSGTQSRSRACDNPPPAGAGLVCVGDEDEYQSCNTESCDIDGGWGSWGKWGKCSLSCGGGTRSRTRACDDPPPRGAGADCVGDADEYEACNEESCDTATTQAPVDGKWGSWDSWASCSKTCGTGLKTRTRDCDDPAPVGMGADCSGDSEETSICIEESCTKDGYSVTSEMTFSSGVTSSNFDSIKDDLADAIADTLGVDNSTVELTLKSDLRSSSIVVVVTITTTDEDIADTLQDDIDSNSFVSDVNTAISSSPALSAAGVVLNSVAETSCGGCAVPTMAPKKPKKCKNRLDYRTCGKAAMKGKCSRPWWQYFCKATCKRCCGNIWEGKRCKRLMWLCKKKNKAGQDVRKKCRKACGLCE